VGDKGSVEDVDGDSCDSKVSRSFLKVLDCFNAWLYREFIVQTVHLGRCCRCMCLLMGDVIIRRQLKTPQTQI